MDDTLAIILLAGVPLLILLSGFLYHLRSVRKERERRAVLVRERLAAIKKADYERMHAAHRHSTPLHASTRPVPASYTTSRSSTTDTTSAADDLLSLALINSITSSSETSRPTSWSSSDSSSSWSSSDSSSSWSSSDSGSSPSSDW